MYKGGGAGVKDEGGSEGEFVISDTSDVDEAEAKELIEGFDELDMSKEAIYHAGHFDGLLRDCIGDTDILEEFFGPDVEN